MEGADDFRFSLCVSHPSLRPVDISESLKIQPQLAWGVGDLVGSRVRASTLWRGTLSEGSGAIDFDRSLSEVLSVISNAKEFLHRITSSGGELSLTIRTLAEAQGGKAAEVRLNALFLEVLVRLSIDLVLEVWMDATQVQEFLVDSKVAH